jgi:3-oxoacyl-[acyl-carrier protein] reductase
LTDDPRTVVVSGGGTRVGRAIALDCARAGETIVVAGAPEDALHETTRRVLDQVPGSTAIYKPCDASQPEQVEAFATWLKREHGHIDVLVNSADVELPPLPEQATLSEVTTRAHEVFGGGLIGVYCLCRELSPLLARPGGKIVNVATLGGMRGDPNHLNQLRAMIRSGLMGLTQTLALRYGPAGVTVNMVAGGFIPPDERFFSAANRELQPGRVRALVSAHPIQRLGRPEDVAAAVRYLASSEASWVSGEIHHVDGGRLAGRCETPLPS